MFCCEIKRDLPALGGPSPQAECPGSLGEHDIGINITINLEYLLNFFSYYQNLCNELHTVATTNINWRSYDRSSTPVLMMITMITMIIMIMKMMSLTRLITRNYPLTSYVAPVCLYRSE